VGWAIYWHVLAGAAERRVQDWIATQNDDGAQASVAHIVRRGFPVLLRLELQDLAYAPARAGWRVETGRVDLNVEMLNPEHVIFQAKRPIMVTRGDGALTRINADALVASLRTAHGALAVAGVEADNLALDDPAQEGVLLIQKLVVNARPDPRITGEYQVAFEARSMTLPRPVRSLEAFGLDVAALRAAIVVERGAELLESSPGDPLGPWRDAGGKLRFEALTLNWGPLEASGHGEGGLDSERRIEGALELPIEHPARVFNAIANGQDVDRDAKRALALLAAGYAISGDDITLDIDAHDGWLRLEGLTLRPLGRVY
jgi:hypothetical protein